MPKQHRPDIIVRNGVNWIDEEERRFVEGEIAPMTFIGLSAGENLGTRPRKSYATLMKND